MAEPWDITSAFARQLMQDAAERDRANTGLAMAPINQAMAMERLKEQTALELATLPKKLSIEDAVAQAREGRAYGRQKETEARAEGTVERAEQRDITTNLPAKLDLQTRKDVEAHRGKLEADIKAEKENPAYFEKYRIHPRAVGIQNQHVPPTPEGWEGMVLEDVTSEAFDKLKNDPTVELGKPRPAFGKNYIPYRSKAPNPGPTNKSSSINDPPRPAATIPFDALPQPNNDVKQPAPDAPQPPTRPKDLLGGKDKLSFLYESIRRRGYSDEEAKTILADLQKKPEARPTDDPDIFDVLVA